MRQTPLHELHLARGAEMFEYQGWEIPRAFGAFEAEYGALTQSVALADLSYRGRLRIVGRDRATWLHGQVTQDIVHLEAGRGLYTTVLTPQGQMVSDLRVFNLGESLLLDTPPGTAFTLAKYLDRYLVMERALIENATEELVLLSLQGPQALQAIERWLGRDAAALEPGQIRPREIEGAGTWITRDGHCGEAAWDLFVPVAHAADVWGCICARCPELGLFAVGWEALNTRRIEAGIPWWGHELDTHTVPFEARLDRAIHLDKGCYVGQEVIARLHARGQVNNLLAGLALPEGDLPEAGSRLFIGDARVGRLTSAVRSPALKRNIALGYLRREHLCIGAEVRVGEGDAAITARVAELPFVPARGAQEMASSA